MPVPLRNPFAVPARLRRLQIEITTGCNLRCAGCQRTLGMTAGTWHNAHMPAQRFAAILANAPPSDTIILQGIGEPTLHPDLPQLVASARAAGKFGAISFNTNALVREPEYYRHLRAAGLNHVSVSVDSLDPQTAEATRAGTDCERLTEAIRALIALFGPTVTLSILLSRMNAQELPSLLRRLYALGARYVEVQPLIAYGATTQPLCLTASELTLARRQIAEAHATLPGLQMMPAAALTPNGNRCRRPLHAAYVTVDGFLTPCCTTNDASLFGRANLAESSFAALWQSEGVAGWLNAYVDREPAICPGCAFNPAGVPPPALDDAEHWLRDGRLDAAEAGFRAIGGDALHAGALHGLGLVRLQRGDAAGALPLLQAAFALAPDARTGHNLATALATLGRIDEAIATGEHVVTVHPDYVPAQFALAGMLVGRNDPRAATLFAALCERTVPAQRFDLAEQCVAQLENLPAPAETSMRLANLLRGAGRQDLALRLLQPRLRTDPNDIAAHLVSAMCQLAVVHATEDEIATRRADYTHALTTLDNLTATATHQALAAAIGQVGDAKPFLLAYQGQDDRTLQQTYGRIVSRISQAAWPTPAISPPARDGRLRIGFASAYFHLHSVSKLFGGWMRHLDRSRFEVFGYQLGADIDATSKSLAACCAEYRYGTASAATWTQRIVADQLDALIYPELGMHPLPVQLGCQRLAPVQCVAWGHPTTSGLPQIDYFLSSALMEQPDADRHYTEQLVRLPNLSIAYAALPDRGGVLARDTLGLRDDAVVYVCCQSLFKYLPRYDTVFAQIAALVPAAQFLFIGAGTPPAALFRARLDRFLAAAGLSMERHVRVIPPVPIEDFSALLRCADVYLDSIGWSGGNTTLEAVACDLPVVTMPTGLMRGRHSAAILEHMGLGGHVAGSVEDFVARAVQLANAPQRNSFRDAICESRHRLYDDLVPVRALEDFLATAITRDRPPAVRQSPAIATAARSAIMPTTAT
jgi:predicted O-linked N-acetylglucosamine transferase (SPINDLY family)/MoaA/NifB/PqqE/SkfB family radical SAM enzyme